MVNVRHVSDRAHSIDKMSYATLLKMIEELESMRISVHFNLFIDIGIKMEMQLIF